jgi:hypothetical protein
MTNEGRSEFLTALRMALQEVALDQQREKAPVLAGAFSFCS